MYFVPVCRCRRSQLCASASNAVSGQVNESMQRIPAWPSNDHKGDGRGQMRSKQAFLGQLLMTRNASIYTIVSELWEALLHRLTQKSPDRQGLILPMIGCTVIGARMSHWKWRELSCSQAEPGQAIKSAVA